MLQSILPHDWSALFSRLKHSCCESPLISSLRSNLQKKSPYRKLQRLSLNSSTISKTGLCPRPLAYAHNDLSAGLSRRAARSSNQLSSYLRFDGAGCAVDHGLAEEVQFLWILRAFVGM